MTDLVSLPFVAMIPIDCKIHKYFLTLVMLYRSYVSIETADPDDLQNNLDHTWMLPRLINQSTC